MNARKRTRLAGVALVFMAVSSAGCASTGQSTASPKPAAAASQSASPAAPSTSPSASVAAGTSVWRAYGHRLGVTVPAGWLTDQGGAAKHPDQPGELGVGIWEPVTNVYTDACHSEGKLDPVGATVDDLVGALDDQLSTDATVSTVTLGGRSWKRVDLAGTPGLDRATCRHGAEGPLQIWADPEETGYYAFAPGTTGVVLSTDDAGKRVVVAGGIDAKASAADRAELESIIESLRLEQ